MYSHGHSEEPKNTEGPTNHMAKITETEGYTKGYWGAREERWTQGNGNTWFGEAAEHNTRRVTNCRGPKTTEMPRTSRSKEYTRWTQGQSMSRTKYDAGRKNAEGRCEHRAQRKGWGRKQRNTSSVTYSRGPNTPEKPRICMVQGQAGPNMGLGYKYKGGPKTTYGPTEVGCIELGLT
ncbi:hypothetical protein DFH28DRAFT_929096 [Melampsora americana]|nr:hypothetical protein DFH28DRAFT_929096 [Melampsora americana]